MPVFYECQRCTACCRWPGQVRITDLEITAMSEHLGVSEPDFIQRFTRLATDRRGLSLQVKHGHDCVFLDGDDCRVQPVKPKQCRDFPNRWNFPGWQELCHAIPRQVSAEEYARRMGAGAIPKPNVAALKPLGAHPVEDLPSRHH